MPEVHAQKHEESEPETERETMSDRATAETVLEALRVSYPAPAYAVLPQVRNGTGFARAKVRTADALVMGIWPSRGLELWGVEIKVSRADFVTELKDPEKADEIAKYCDRWYLAISDNDVIEGLSVPSAWGVLVLRNGKMRCTHEASKLKSKPVDRVFLAAIVRKVHEAVHPTSEATRIRARARQDGLEEGKAAAREEARADFKDLADAVKQFEQASGIRIADPWIMGDVGLAVKVLSEFSPSQLTERLQGISDTARFLHESAERSLKAYRTEAGT